MSTTSIQGGGMTVAEARRELRRQLRFGDSQQIKARDVMREVADCREAIGKCDNYGHDPFKCRCTRKWRERADIIRAAGE